MYANSDENTMLASVFEEHCDNERTKFSNITEMGLEKVWK